MSISLLPTPWRVICSDCGGNYLTEKEYTRQLMKPNSTWQCPNCHQYDAMWDDDNYEIFYGD